MANHRRRDRVFARFPIKRRIQHIHIDDGLYDLDLDLGVRLPNLRFRISEYGYRSYRRWCRRRCRFPGACRLYTFFLATKKTDKVTGKGLDPEDQ